MESFSDQHEHEQQLQQQSSSSLHPYCFPLPSLPAQAAFPAVTNLEAAAAMVAYDSSRASSLDATSMSMVYSPMVMQLQKSPLSFEYAAAAGDKKWMPAGTQGSCTCSLGSSQDMDGSWGKSRKHRRSNVGVRGLDEKKKARRVVHGHGDVKANEAGGEPPIGYIHVRARRGQATDSHSLAERVRRGKISERMKMLQSLVPGCDKVTGKALMLDEIISYVQSLQNQVEFLSMKLASLSPMMNELGPGIDMYPDILPQQCMGQGDQLGRSTIGISLQAQGPTGFAQDGSSSSHMNMNMVVMQVGEQGQQQGPLHLHQLEMSGLCFFQ